MKNQKTVSTHSHWHRVLTWAVLIGIFICGVMAGAFIWQKKMANTADSGVQTNLVGYNKKVSKCQMREEALLANVASNIKDTDISRAIYLHRENAKIYKKLASLGCEENKARYEDLASAEDSVADALKDFDYGANDDYYEYGGGAFEESEKEPCEVIERTLRNRIDRNCSDSWCHLNNAEVYSKMAEDGCPENKETNTKFALDELQIAEGVRIDDTNVGENDIRATVNTYKKLQMQNEAKKYINKVEKLVNPGIDFILELQRIVEE